MLNQVSKKILKRSFNLNNKLTQNQKSYLTKTVKYSLFNSGKYDLNKDYYAILGLTKDADQVTIKKEYYKLAKQHHPDVNPSASQKIKLINQAYSILSDEKIKAQYDEARQVNETKQKFNQKRQHYQSENDYRAQYYKQYQKAYQQMNEYERFLMRKTFSRFFGRLFLFGFALTLFMAIFSPKRMMIDEFGRPVDIHGRPIDRYNNAMIYQAQPPIYDPYNLGGPPKSAYPYQTMYGRQYAAGAPGNAQNQGYM